jgi:hypothetical protein
MIFIVNPLTCHFIYIAHYHPSKRLIEFIINLAFQFNQFSLKIIGFCKKMN